LLCPSIKPVLIDDDDDDDDDADDDADDEMGIGVTQSVL
jgi:hypothetical protein